MQLTPYKNWTIFPAMVFAIVVAFIFNYIPSLQRTIGTRAISVEHWFLPAAFGVGILLLDEGRKYCVRTWPRGLLARIAW